MKDTIHKHSLLYHMTYWVLEKFPDSGDLYSELGPVIRSESNKQTYTQSVL